LAANKKGRKSSSGPSKFPSFNFPAFSSLFLVPIRVHLSNRRPNRKPPGEHGQLREFFGNHILMLSLFHGHSRLVQLHRLLLDVVKRRPEHRNRLLSAELSVARNEQRVLIP